MKKKWSTPRYKRAQEIRLHHRQRRLRRESQARSDKGRRRRARKRDIRPIRHIHAPEVFSIADNPEVFFGFLTEIQRHAARHIVSVKLGAVRTITPEAVAAFVALIGSLDDARIQGDVPADQAAQQKLLDCGFYDCVDSQYVGSTQGEIHAGFSDWEVKGRVAQKLVEFADSKTGILHKPSYSMFMECWSNTFQHAPGKRRVGTERWWASVFYDAARDTICFTSVDRGTGILANPTFKQRVHFWVKKGRLSRMATPAERLQAMLEGMIPSRTNEKHRGRGLPAFMDAWKKSRISNLVVASNGAIAVPEMGRYTSLSNEFEGTLVYWEVVRQS